MDNKFSVEKVIQIDSALTAVEGFIFDFKTNLKISDMKESTEKIAKQFNKFRNDKVKQYRCETDSIQGKREGVDYTFISMHGQYNVPMLTESFEMFIDDLEKAKDDLVEIVTRSFNLSEFETEENEKDENGKTKKVKKSQVNAAFIRIMKPFLTEVPTLDVVKG